MSQVDESLRERRRFVSYTTGCGHMRLTNPYSAVERLVSNGFGIIEKRRHWSTSNEVLVLRRVDSSRHGEAGRGSRLDGIRQRV